MSKHWKIINGKTKPIIDSSIWKVLPMFGPIEVLETFWIVITIVTITSVFITIVKTPKENYRKDKAFEMFRQCLVQSKYLKRRMNEGMGEPTWMLSLKNHLFTSSKCFSKQISNMRLYFEQERFDSFDFEKLE